MENSTKLLIGGGVTLVAGIGIAFALRKKTSAVIVTEEVVNVPDSKTIPTNQTSNEFFPLVKGMNGNKIRAMQDVLRSKFNNLSLVSDGALGPRTEAAIINAGYSLPLSETDYNSILKGTKKTVVNPKNVTTGTLKAGDRVYAKVNGISIYTKPLTEVKYLKKSFSQFDSIGVYMGASTVNGWSKVYTGEFGDVFILTNGITNIKP